MDAESGEPLVFASVGLKGKSIGTISNAIGEFDFHIPIENSDLIFEIHMLGYESFELEVSEVIRRGLTEFSLTRTLKFLDEVIVSDSLSGGDIFTIAVNRIDQNYPSEPFILDGFYRDVKSVGGTYVALLEAAVKVYDKDYKAPKQKMRLRERVTLVEVRKSLGYDNKFTTFFDQTNLLEDLLLHNNVRYRQFPGDSDEAFISKLQRTDVDFYNGRRIFLIQLENSDRLKFYIDATTFSFLRVEYELGISDEVIDRKGNLYSKMKSLKKIIDFREYYGSMYLNHINLETEVNWYDRSNEVKFTTKLHQQLMVNKVFPATSQKIGPTETMKKFGLQYQQRAYNKEFWDNYNVIKETPLDKSIIDDLEKDLSLERQFQNKRK